MIKKFEFSLTMLILCSSTHLLVQTVNSKDLLWKKDFGQKIRSVAISKNGNIALALESRIIKMIKDGRYYTDVTDEKGIKYIWGGSKLYYLDKKGNVLWEYKVKEMQELSYVSISNNGKYVVCSLDEVEEYEGKYGEKEAIYQEWYGQKILFFNSKGKLLWSFKASGKPIISSNGDYVFIIPQSTEDVQPADDFYFLNKKGKMLWKINSTKQSFYFYYPPYAMSKKFNRIAIGNILYDKNGNILWKIKKEMNFFDISESGLFGIIEGDAGIICVDLVQKKVLWEMKYLKLENPPYSPSYIRPFTKYFIDEKNKKLVTLQDKKINKEFLKKHKLKDTYGEVKIYNLVSGRLIKKIQNPSEYERLLAQKSRQDIYEDFADGKPCKVELRDGKKYKYEIRKNKKIFIFYKNED